MTISSSTAMPRSDLAASLELVQVKPGLRFSKAALLELLPTVEDILFFGKLYDLDHVQLSALLQTLVQTPLVQALLGGVHSTELQDYLVDLTEDIPHVTAGDINLSPTVPHGEILPQMWEQLEVEVANSIKAVAAKLESVVSHMPGKQGQMLFKSLAVMNAKRPTIGDHRAVIHHARAKAPNLVILDVSGSMTEQTIGTIVNDVVAMSYAADAHLAIVSDTCTVWEPGTYGTTDVLDKAEFSGTRYETLAPLFDGHDWGVVVTVADYDSSWSAKGVLARCTAKVDEVLDISLVNRPTYLAECVGQLAKSTRPLLIGNSQHVLND